MKKRLISDFALIERLFPSALVRQRMAANHLGIILTRFASDLHSRGYTAEGVRHHVLAVEHFGEWLKEQEVCVRRLSTVHVQKFLRSHLPQCHCPRPAPKVPQDCRASLRRFVEFLRSQRQIEESDVKAVPLSPADRLLAAYDQHLHQVCGISEEIRRRRRLGARQFLNWRFGCGPVRWNQLLAKEVARYVFSRARKLGPTGIRALVVNLRSFLRFLEFSRRVRRGLAGAVP